MRAIISAKGYTNVILVLNFKRFIRPEDQAKFETIRGTKEFASVIRKDWLERIQNTDFFHSTAQISKLSDTPETMSTAEIGFATGVFRSLFLGEFSFPTYRVDKAQFSFDDLVKENFQFRKLFKPAWNAWNIYIRPTASGLFIIRLSREYQKPRELVKIGEDVLRLQEALDVQSAHRWLERKKDELKGDLSQLNEVEKSVSTFLEWLGADGSKGIGLTYIPVQWKIAMHVCSQFVDCVGEIPFKNGGSIHLKRPEPSLSIPLHDSYVVFHIDEIFADHTIIKNENGHLQAPANEPIRVQTNGRGCAIKPLQQPVMPAELRRSPLIKQTLLSLLEGAILDHPILKGMPAEDSHQQPKGKRYFPAIRQRSADTIFDENLASWIEEICLITSRSALIVPSRKYREDCLFVSTTPGATLKVKYESYWQAIERMIEFVVETRVLTQLIERDSYRLLEQMTRSLHEVRLKLRNGNIELDKKEYELICRANDVRRLAAMAQGMSNPLLWSRAEYAVLKAGYLLDKLGVPTLLTHIDRNISSLNSIADHVDELHAVDIGEKSNDLSMVLTIALAGASFILTVIALPSLWTDYDQLKNTLAHNNVMYRIPGLWFKIPLDIVTLIGTILAFGLILASFLLCYQSLPHYRNILKVINQSMKRLGR